MGFSERLAEFGGLPVLDFPTDPRAPVPECGESSAAVAWWIDCWGETESGKPYVFEDAFHRFLNEIDTTRLTALVFGSWGDLAFAESHHPARSLVAEAARFPALRAVFFGDIVDDGERPEIVYIEHIDLGPVLTAFPALEELWVRGTPAWTEEPIRAISECDFPELRHLERYLGHPDWMGHARAADLAWLLAGGTFPKLDHLGLRNALIQNEIAMAAAQAPVVAGFRVLDLSLGALGDGGGTALLHGQPLDHLTELDLHHNYFSKAMQDRLRAAWPGVDVDLSGRRTDDGSGHRYVGIGA